MRTTATKAGKPAATARPKRARQPNTGKATASTPSNEPKPQVARKPTLHRPKVTAAELLKQERKLEQQEEITEAGDTLSELIEMRGQLAEFERARAALEREHKKPSAEFVALERKFRDDAERLQHDLEAKGEDVARIAQFRAASQRLREMAPRRPHTHGPDCERPCKTPDPNADYEPPAEGEYIEAIHGLLEVTDHQSVDPGAYKRLDETDQRHLVFCPCREHRQNEYMLDFGRGRKATFRGTFFSLDSYGKSKAIRASVDNAVRIYAKVREAIRGQLRELKDLGTKAVTVTAADVLNLETEGLVAVPVFFRNQEGDDAEKPAGNLFLECSGNEVTLRAATHIGMQKILSDCMGQTLAGGPRKDGKPGVWFEGPKLLISVLQSAWGVEREAARSERERAHSTLTIQKADPVRAVGVEKLEQLGEKLRSEEKSPRRKPSRKSTSEAEGESKPKARTRRQAEKPTAEVEDEADVEAAASAAASTDADPHTERTSSGSEPEQTAMAAALRAAGVAAEEESEATN